MCDNGRAEPLEVVANRPRSPQQRKVGRRGAKTALFLLALTCIHFHFRDYDKLSSFTSRRLSSFPFATFQVASSPHISYQMWRNNSFQNLYSQYYACKNDQHRLHPDMQDTLNFSTTVSTNLKILFMGDSVAVQNAQSFQEAVGATNRSILRYSWGKHEGLFVSDARGGGVVAGWRITGILQRSGEGKQLPNFKGGGWRRSDARKLLNHTVAGARNEKIGAFDVVVFRIPHGWMKLNAITESKLNESVALANELFGATNIIYLSLPFINNVMTEEDLQELHETNIMLKEFAQKNHSAVENIMVLDFGQLGDALTEFNGRLLGYETNNTDYLFERLKCLKRKKIGQSIAQVCSKRVKPGEKKCSPGNAFSIDGLHWCSETLNGRLNAGTACLIQCLYSDHANMRTCEKDCNDRFMSLRPIDVFADESFPSTAIG